MSFLIKAKVVENAQTAESVWKMTLAAPAMAAAAVPGQFIHFKCGEGPFPLLRRPFSIHSAERDNIDILYKVVGAGTKIMTAMKEGDTADIMGPLGNGFVLPTEKTANSTAILVGGGIGVAPLVFLCNALAQKKLFDKIKVFLGASACNCLLCEERFTQYSAETSCFTDDGSKGEKGFVTLGLLRDIAKIENAAIFACGPTPMLKAVCDIAEKTNTPCQVSLEEKMACGAGVCLGCPVKIKNGDGFVYKLTCKDGPVFNGNEIVW